MIDVRGSRRGRLRGESVLRLISAGALACLWALLGSATTAMAETRYVLELHSSTRFLPANVERERALQAALDTSATRQIELYAEFLDVPRFSGEAYSRAVATFLREKYSAHPPEVVIVAGQEALAFWLANRSAIFPRAPVVHMSIDGSVLRQLPDLPSDVIGAPMEYDSVRTVDLALRLHPRATQLVLVTGASEWDRQWEARLRRDVTAFQDRANVVFLAGLPIAAIRKRLAELGANAVVYSPGFYADGDGRVFTPAASVRALAADASAPIYGPFDTFVGTGAVGGYMPSFATIGQRAGQIVGALLDGASPTARSLLKPIPTALNVDWRQVHHWGIDEKAIPVDAVVQFREPSVWEEYRNEIVITIVALVVQAQLIVWLLVERRRRRKAQHAEQGLRTELAHGARLAMAGELIGSIAHEINQPLGAILSNADTADHILDSDSDPSSEMRAIVADIRRDDLRASEVILRLRRLLSQHEVERRPLDVNHAALDVEPILRAEAKRRGVALAIEFAPGAVTIVGDRIQIQQVLINLVLNAMDAEQELPDDLRRVALSVAASDTAVTIAVRDWGHGIAPENLPKIFESFFTTKQDGMGLGLSITRSIVEAHGGRISAENRAPGALFQVELPLREATAGGAARDA